MIQETNSKQASQKEAEQRQITKRSNKKNSRHRNPWMVTYILHTVKKSQNHNLRQTGRLLQGCFTVCLLNLYTLAYTSACSHCWSESVN